MMEPHRPCRGVASWKGRQGAALSREDPSKKSPLVAAGGVGRAPLFPWRGRRGPYLLCAHA
jgi:hypothetical protein